MATDIQEELIQGILNDSADDIEAALARGADPCGEISGATALHIAAVRGNSMATTLLLRSGAHANVQDTDGKTPLHYVVKSVSQDAPDTIRVLLEAGANVSVKDNSGATALDDAAFVGEAEIVRLLVGAGGKCSTHEAQQRVRTLLAASKNDNRHP